MYIYVCLNYLEILNRFFWCKKCNIFCDITLWNYYIFHIFHYFSAYRFAGVACRQFLVSYWFYARVFCVKNKRFLAPMSVTDDQLHYKIHLYKYYFLFFSFLFFFSKINNISKLRRLNLKISKSLPADLVWTESKSVFGILNNSLQWLLVRTWIFFRIDK